MHIFIKKWFYGVSLKLKSQNPKNQINLILCIGVKYAEKILTIVTSIKAFSLPDFRRRRFHLECNPSINKPLK
jgi:hypothetical protein